MKKIRIHYIAAVAILLFLCVLCACGSRTVSAIPLGSGLPDYPLSSTYRTERLPADAKSAGLLGIYVTDSDAPDYRLYRFPKNDGDTLESFGQAQAAEKHVFCNMKTENGCPAAVLNYYEETDGAPYIVQAFIFEGENGFTELCTLFKTEEIRLGTSEYAVQMMRGAAVTTTVDGVFDFDAVYRFESDHLPEIAVREFPKATIPAKAFDGAAEDEAGLALYDACAADGWTQEEIISVFAARFSLLKGEIMQKNGLDLAFIGFIDQGIFKVRAFLDNGDGYILLCAEDDAASFQHVTNALLDSIH